jgi:hypothetical protein
MMYAKRSGKEPLTSELTIPSNYEMRVPGPALVTDCDPNLSKFLIFQRRYRSVTLYHGQMDCSQLMKMESGPS